MNGRLFLFLLCATLNSCASFCQLGKSAIGLQKAIEENNIASVRTYAHTQYVHQSSLFKTEYGEMSPLEYAIFLKKADVVSALLQLGAQYDEELIETAYWLTSSSNPPTKEDMLNTLDIIMQHDKNLINNPLFCEFMVVGAINNHDVDILSYFLKLGVSPKTKTQNGWTLLDYAISVSFREGIEILKQFGASEHPHVSDALYPDFDALMKEIN